MVITCLRSKTEVENIVSHVLHTAAATVLPICIDTSCEGREECPRVAHGCWQRHNQRM